MDPILFTSPGRIRILLVPVHPIKASTFQKHVELVKNFNVVKLGDVTPDMRGSQSMFSPALFHEGQLLFNFVTTYDVEHTYLEEFQLHRRIFGVIGIMDCQEWPELTDGYRKFAGILKNYPSALAHRCFAFDPSEHQPDDTKGLIMIPTVGNMGFYMSTMICDFASTILTEFGSLVETIESKTFIESPKVPSLFSSPLLSPNGQLPSHRYSTPTISFTAPDLTSPQTPSFPLTPPSQVLTASSIGSMTAAANAKDQFHGRSFSSSTLATLSNPSSIMPTSMSDLKLKRRTPGRVQKLLADLYLLAGRLPDAVSNYYSAIETTKSNSDYLWHGAALEGLCVSLVLLAYLHADIGPQVLQAPPSPSVSQSSSAPSSPTNPKPLWADIAEKYLNVITLYAKTSNSINNQVPSIVYTEACLKMSKMLACIWLAGEWGDEALKMIVHGVMPTDKAVREKWGLSQVSGVSRVEIAQWAMKGYGIFVEEMSTTEQIHVNTSLASIFSSINFQRKYAFFLRRSVFLILPLLSRSRLPLAQAGKTSIVEDDRLLGNLKQIVDIYGVGDDDEDQKGELSATEEDAQNNFGWPDIQINVLKDAIMISESIPDFHSIAKYTSRLLRRLFLYLPREEQHRLSVSLPRIVGLAKKQDIDMQIKYWGINVVREVRVCRPSPKEIPYPHSGKILSQSDVKKEGNDGPFIYNPFSKKNAETVQTHLVANETAYFIVVLANVYAVDLEIQSISLSTEGVPFAPNVISTTIPANTSVNVKLSGVPTEAGELIIRGCKIKIYGCIEQEFYVYVPPKEEEIKKEDEYGKRVKKRHVHHTMWLAFVMWFFYYLTDICLNQSGLAILYRHRRDDSRASTGTTSSQEKQQMEFLRVTVIPDQPLLKIKSTSLMHRAIMLFEGEKTEMTIALANIGKTPIDFITLSFHDSTIANAQAILSSSDIPPEEAYEMEFYAHKQSVFSWNQSDQQVNLLPGGEWLLTINVFGKRDCTSGTIQIDYGYLNQEQSPNNDTFYTRQVFYPVLLTVNRNLEPLAMDLSNFKPLPDVSSNDSVQPIEHMRQIEELLRAVDASGQTLDKSRLESEYCLLTFDIRNVWHVPFDVTFTVDEGASGRVVTNSTTIQPLSTSRIVLPIQRISLTEGEVTKPIPSILDKQFVVSKAPKGTAEQERLQLALFWYRETLLKRLTTSWDCVSFVLHTVVVRQVSLFLISILNKRTFR
ncbi:1844_t:CDS:10 [Paraglomus occultum]|uniref:1844_t:CDS:1 n=1 Tax=Paraglomus occultum TaxID=144539 RepID=A0A9N9APT4_9GLOM|nr:1844_t:CDS:10 [Paraglomus occultum]